MEPCCSRKKRKRKSLTMESELNWSDLPVDPLVEIAKRLMSSSVEDFMAFRGVCTSWRAASREADVVAAKSTWPMKIAPFLMLSQKENEEGCSNRREFYSLSKRKICMSLPSVPEIYKGKKCIESRFGWLLTISCSRELELINPFSNQRISLPNFKTCSTAVQRFCPQFDIITRSVLSANPSHTSHFVLVLLTTSFMAFWRYGGDTKWTKISPPSGRATRGFLDVNYFNRDRRFYAVTTKGDIFTWDAADSHAPELTFIYNVSAFDFGWNQAYLVEESSSSSSLLLVTRNGRFKRKCSYGATEFQVYHIDVTKGVCQRITSLNKKAIFVGHNAAFSIPVSDDDDHDPTTIIKSNSIYFTDDSIYAYGAMSPYSAHSDTNEGEEDEPTSAAAAKTIDSSCVFGSDTLDARAGGGKDMGIYNLQHGTIQRFHPDAQTLSFTCPPLWVFPSSFSWLP